MADRLTAEEVRAAWRGRASGGRNRLLDYLFVACFPVGISLLLTGLASDFALVVLWAHAVLLLIWLAASGAMFVFDLQWKRSRGVKRKQLERWRITLYVAVVCLLVLTFAEMFIWAGFLSLRRDARVPLRAWEMAQYVLFGLMALGGIGMLVKGSTLNRLIYVDRFEMGDALKQAPQVYRAGLGILGIVIIAGAVTLAPISRGDPMAFFVDGILIAIGLLAFVMGIVTVYQVIVLVRDDTTPELEPGSPDEVETEG